MSEPARTDLEAEADRLDCNLYRIICQVVELAGHQYSEAQGQLYEVARQLRAARPGLRALMHQYDRERT